MIAVADYGGIALVIPHVAAVGGVKQDNDRFEFDVFLTGIADPLVIGFPASADAEEAREDLVALITEYHFAALLGADFDEDDLDEIEEQGEDDGDETH